jgi:hypothetical protein
MPDLPPRQSDGVLDPARPKASSLRRRIAVTAAGLLLAYFVIAYAVMPFVWDRYVHRHPALDDVPGVTTTTVGIPGDPINVALIGTRQDVERVLRAAQWHTADPLGLRSDIKIAAATVLDRPYADAPVSSLYLFGRKEDLAFEKPVGDNPRKRNHVRFWQSAKVDPDGRPVWVGSATYDERVGLSHTTGEVTHHIDGDVDAERDRLFQDLQQTGELAETYDVDGFHKVREGRNGGGDRWHTDGNLRVGVTVVK